jgi:hypothetical protein
MTLKQLQAQNYALRAECTTLRILLATQRAGNQAQRAQRLSNARAQAKHQAKLNKGELLCLD